MSTEAKRATAPVRSMTGYAMVRKETAAGELIMSLRSVNHRGLDLHFHQPAELAIFENAMRALLKEQVARGHIEIRASLARDAGPDTGAYNRDMLERYLTCFRRACEDFGLDGKPDLNSFFQMPGVFEATRPHTNLGSAFELEIIAALDACICELNAHRAREGQELIAGIEREIAAIETQVARIAELRANVFPQFHARFRQRLKELLGETSISENRVVEEAALLADRSDIEEEVTRLRVHVDELRRILRAGGEVGKRLDFLLQEMNRETNTTLAKSSAAGDAGLEITNLGLAIKANIEKIREQALNLE